MMKPRKLCVHLNFQAHMSRFGLNSELIQFFFYQNRFLLISVLFLFRRNGQKTFILLVCAMGALYADFLYKAKYFVDYEIIYNFLLG